MTKKRNMICPITGCNFMTSDEDEWIQHFKNNHPEVDTLNLGGKRIRIKE